MISNKYQFWFICTGIHGTPKINFRKEKSGIGHKRERVDLTGGNFGEGQPSCYRSIKQPSFGLFFAIFVGWENQMRPHGMKTMAAKHLNTPLFQLLKIIKIKLNHHSLMFMTSMATMVWSVIENDKQTKSNFHDLIWSKGLVGTGVMESSDLFLACSRGVYWRQNRVTMTWSQGLLGCNNI